MSAFTVRIELHSDNYSDFITLHSEMERRKFRRTITSDGGQTYHLPRAEYDITTTAGRSQVLASAKEAIGVTRKSAEILVTESAGRSWHGLSEVR